MNCLGSSQILHDDSLVVGYCVPQVEQMVRSRELDILGNGIVTVGEVLVTFSLGEGVKYVGVLPLAVRGRRHMYHGWDIRGLRHFAAYYC